MEQMKNTGKKAAEKLSNAASNAGTNLMKLIKNADTTPELQLSECRNYETKKRRSGFCSLYFSL